MGFSLSNFFGKDDRRRQDEEAAKGDRAAIDARAIEQNQVNITSSFAAKQNSEIDYNKDRRSGIYDPLEQSLANYVGGPADLEGEAAIAGGQFSTAFDNSLRARTQQQQQQGVNYRPGSSASRMQGENDALNRASGIASSMNTARREEEDAHFVRQNAFFQSGSTNVQNQVNSGLNTLYGAEITGAQNQALYARNESLYRQGISDQYGQQSLQGINTLAQFSGAGAALLSGVPT